MSLGTALLFLALPLGAAPNSPESSDSALDAVASRLPAYAALASTDIQVPAPSIALGASSKAYLCWKLQLTGAHGRQVRTVMERLRSIRDAAAGLRDTLSRDLLLHASGAGGPALRERILAQDASLDSLRVSYENLLQAGLRGGLLKVSERGLLREGGSVTARLRKDDYTMVHDESQPGCPPTRPPR